MRGRAAALVLTGLLLLLALAILTAPLSAEAQPTGRIYRIGFLRDGPPPETFIEGLRKGLREPGYVEGQNISIEYGLARSADELPGAAARLVSLKHGPQAADVSAPFDPPLSLRKL